MVTRQVILAIFLAIFISLASSHATEPLGFEGESASSIAEEVLSNGLADNYAEYAASFPEMAAVCQILESESAKDTGSPRSLDQSKPAFVEDDDEASTSSGAERIESNLPFAWLRPESLDSPSLAILPVSYDCPYVATECECECECVVPCGCANRCCTGRQGWSEFDALLWFPKRGNTGRLVARSPVGTPNAALGIRENSTTLYGGGIGDSLSAGGRMRAGWWFDPARQMGIQQEFFALGSGGDFVQFGGNEDILVRPFFNTNTSVNGPDAQVFNMPGVADGTTTFRNSTEVFSSASAIRWNVGDSGSQRTDMSLGYRFFRMDEEFSSRERLAPTGSSFVTGSFYELDDQMKARNVFHGAEFGVDHIRRYGAWGWDVGASVAVGRLRRSVAAAASTQVVIPGFSNTTLPGGFFLGPEDVGRTVGSDTAVVPQARFNVTRSLGGGWRLRAGYSFLYLSNAFRPYSLADSNFDGARLANANATPVAGDPSLPPSQGVWLHGVNVGLVSEF